MKLLVDNLTFRFRKTDIFSEASFHAEAGKAIAVLGKNGSGKTTFLKLLCGLLTPESGSIRYVSETGENGNGNRPPIGGFLEVPGFFNEMTGRENAEYFLEKQYDKKQIEEQFRSWNLFEKIDTPVQKYSLGMKQRLAIIIAMESKAPVLLFDEPTNSLDSDSVVEFCAQVNRAKAEGRIIILVTHLMYDLQICCDEVYKIEDKKLRETAEKNVPVNRYEIHFVTENDAREAKRILEPQRQCRMRGTCLTVETEEESATQIIRQISHLEIMEVVRCVTS